MSLYRPSPPQEQLPAYPPEPPVDPAALAEWRAACRAAAPRVPAVALARAAGAAVEAIALTVSLAPILAALGFLAWLWWG